MKEKLFRSIMKINHLYSVAYIAVTGTDKNYYRENSKVHSILSDIAFTLAK